MVWEGGGAVLSEGEERGGDEVWILNGEKGDGKDDRD